MFCIYRSPSTNVRSFIETLSKVLKEYKCKGGCTVLIGIMTLTL